MKKILRDNRGSISTVITVTVLFFLTILSTAYMVTSANRKAQIKSELVAKKTYEDPLNHLVEISSELNAIKVGDYVNYTYDTAENYTMSATTCGSSSNPTDGIAQTVGLRWKILNIDKNNKTIDLISENPTSAEVYFSGVLGYNNAPYFMNEICKAQYSNKNLKIYARSVTLVDMEKKLTDTGLATRNTYTTAAQYGKTKTYTGTNSYYPSLYAYQKGAGINKTTVTQPSLTKGNYDPYEESKKIATVEPTTDASTGQATAGGLTATQTYYNIQLDSGNYGDAAKVLSNVTFFWIASRCVGNYSDVARFGLRYASTYMDARHMMYSNGDTYERGYGLRPVVTINFSNLTGTKDSNGAWNMQDTVPSVTEQIKIGDYVNYTYDTAGDYTVDAKYSGNASEQKVTQTKGLKWQVLSINSNTVDLVSSTLTDVRVTFSGALGYNNGVYILNDICAKQYSNSRLAITARSINIKDVERHLTSAGIAARNADKSSANIAYGNTNTYQTGYNLYPKAYEKEIGAGINNKNVIQPSITEGNDPYDESNAIYTSQTTETSQEASGELTTTQTSYGISINNVNFDDAATILEKGTAYWIASRYVSAGTTYAHFGLRVARAGTGGYYLFRSNGSDGSQTNVLRPVVTMPLSRISKTKDSDGAWNVN